MRILYFGPARELAGIESEEVLIEDAVVSCSDLRARLLGLHPSLERCLAVSRIAANMEYVTETDLISSVAEVAIIPPVAGG